jgi:hypothetical protein
MITRSIWVADPETGREYDIAPLFSAWHELDQPENTPLNQSAHEVIQQTIRTLNVTVHDPAITLPVQLANLYRDLHRLSDMFVSMQERIP